jgi:hypothetical protein
MASSGSGSGKRRLSSANEPPAKKRSFPVYHHYPNNFTEACFNRLSSLEGNAKTLLIESENPDIISRKDIGVALSGLVRRFKTECADLEASLETVYDAYNKTPDNEQSRAAVSRIADDLQKMRGSLHNFENMAVLGKLQVQLTRFKDKEAKNMHNKNSLKDFRRRSDEQYDTRAKYSDPEYKQQISDWADGADLGNVDREKVKVWLADPFRSMEVVVGTPSDQTDKDLFFDDVFEDDPTLKERILKDETLPIDVRLEIVWKRINLELTKLEEGKNKGKGKA